METQRYPQGILISCEVPWDQREEMLEDVFRRQVRMARAAGFTDMYVFGTAGEGYAVDTRRFAQVVRVFREETTAPEVRAMVGVIALSTSNAIERISIAHAAGFRLFQISLPSWGALRDGEILRFFRDVCGQFPDSGFLHYNLPRTKRLLTGLDYRRLADAVPNLVASKNTGGGAARARDLMKHAPEIQHFFGEDNFPIGIQYGPCSLLSSFGPLLPALSRQLYQAGVSGDLATLFRTQRQFGDFLQDVFGPLMTEERIDGVYDKMIVRSAGVSDFPLRLLSPYDCFDEAQYQAWHERYLQWKRAN